MNRNITLIDTTLRDGEQAPGVRFSPDEKYILVEELIDAGVHDFEIGTPAAGFDEQEAISRLLSANFEANLSVWCRAMIGDLNEALKLGARRVNLSLPVSDIQLNAIGKNKDWVFDQLGKCLNFASVYFDYVTVGAQDASRASAGMLDEYVSFTAQFPVVKRIRLADTVGIMDPFSVFDMVEPLVSHHPGLSFEFHAHNDLGMATANSLAAIKAGADALSLTVNGLGERCGNAPLEEVVLALEKNLALPAVINKIKLQSICHWVARHSHRQIHPSKPFSGEMCFTHESGIHTRSLLVDELAYQPFDPSEIGREKRFVFGKHSGSAAIRDILSHHGFALSNTEIETFMALVKRTAAACDFGLSAQEVIGLYIGYIETKNLQNEFCGNNNWIFDIQICEGYKSI